MTTTKKKTEQCTICGNMSDHLVVTSTNRFGSSDLDTRPPLMVRYTINMWIQTCPSCSYCAPSISKKIEGASEIVKSNSYQQQLENPEFPKLVNAFLCYSLIQENIGDYVRAGWSSIHAAWVCDDESSTTGAHTCRERAITLLKRARVNNQKFGEQPGVEEALLVDLLRRAGRFKEALKTCEDGLHQKPEKLIADILHFEKTLIGEMDDTRHLVSEAVKNA